MFATARDRTSADQPEDATIEDDRCTGDTSRVTDRRDHDLASHVERLAVPGGQPEHGARQRYRPFVAEAHERAKARALWDGQLARGEYPRQVPRDRRSESHQRNASRVVGDLELPRATLASDLELDRQVAERADGRRGQYSIGADEARRHPGLEMRIACEQRHRAPAQQIDIDDRRIHVPPPRSLWRRRQTTEAPDRDSSRAGILRRRARRGAIGSRGLDDPGKSTPLEQVYRRESGGAVDAEDVTPTLRGGCACNRAGDPHP